MSAERVIERILDGEAVIGESDRLMSRKQALVAAGAMIEPCSVLILDGASYRPIVVGDIANLAANTTADLLAVNYFRLKARTGTKRTALLYQDCRLNAKKLGGISALNTSQKATLFAKMKAQNIQAGY